MESQGIDAESLKKAVKNLDEYLWNITNNVVCTICHELFTEPVTTSCGHSFCSNCLKRLLYGVNSTKNGCPLCRHPIKRREAKNNHVLSKIAKICSSFPSAFEEDVTGLNPDLSDMGRELVSSSRMSQMSSEKDKEKSKRRVKRQNKNESVTEFNDSVVPNSEPGNEDSVDLKSISQMDLKSELFVAESPDVEKKLKKVRRVASKQKVSEWLEDVGKNLNGKIEDSGSSLGKDKEDASFVLESDNKTSGTSMVRVDYDKSGKSGLEDTFKTVTYASKTLGGEENDPYEFIASQRIGAGKPKRKSSRGRKKTVPEFQSILNFTKENVRKKTRSADREDEAKDLDDSSVVFDKVGDNILLQTHKTYSKKQSSVDATMQRSTGRGSHRKIVSDSEESNASAHLRTCNDNPARKSRARRRLLTPCPDSDSDNSREAGDSGLVAKKPKLDTVAENANNSALSNSRTESDHSAAKNSEGKKAKSKLKTVEVPANASKSPGWSRVSNLKMDFENAEKRNRPCRKSLNISGGEPSSSASKAKSAVELSPEGERGIVGLNDDSNLYIDDLSQCSQLVVGFESHGSAEKEKVFRRVVEDLEKELEDIDKSVVSVSDGKVVEEKAEGKEAEADVECGKEVEDEDVRKPEAQEMAMTSVSPRKADCEQSAKDVIVKTPNRRTIPFALLGKIRKRRKSSISFMKLGKLSPNLKRSRHTVVKLIFPKTTSRSAKKTETATVATQTAELPSDECNGEPVQTASKSVQCETVTSDQVEIEIQTTQSYLRATTKEVQTSQVVDRKTATIQTDAVPSQAVERRSVTIQTGVADSQIIPSQIFEEFNTPHPPSQRNRKESQKKETQPQVDMDVDFDSDIRCELNTTWTTDIQTQRPVEKEKMPPATREEQEVVDLEVCSNATDELVQKVVDNVNLDLARARAASARASPAKRAETCEESDSDIFIEQTPPRSTSSVRDDGNRSEASREVKETEESFLVVSQCQNSISDQPIGVSSRQKLSFPTKDSFTGKDATRKENDENNQNQLNRKPKSEEKEAQGKRMCIVSSGVVNRKNVERFVKMFNAEYSSNPRKDMTHLVVGMHRNEDDELVPFCTPKLLYAIANKKWVVAEAWIEYCLHSNKLAKEEHFESVDPVGGNGCTLARLSKGNLLENCEVYLLGEYDRITKEEFSDLIRDCGGTIVRQPRDFSYSKKKIRMILADGSDLQGDAEIRTLAKKYRTLVMSRDVIIVSIQSYKFANFTPFLLHPISLEECLSWGYPYELVKSDAEDNGKEEESESDREG